MIVEWPTGTLAYEFMVQYYSERFQKRIPFLYVSLVVLLSTAIGL